VDLTHLPVLDTPAALWHRLEMRTALAERDMGAVFRLVRQHTGAPQTRIAAAIGLGQGRANEVFNGRRRITQLDVLERCAAGLSMPDRARIQLGLAPAGSGSDIASQAAVNNEIREGAAAATRIDLLVVRALGLIALNDSLLRPALTAPRDTRLIVRVLLLDPDSPAAAARAAAIGETPAAFTAGIRMSFALLEELAAVPHLDLAVAMYATPPVWRLIRIDDVLYVSVFADGVDGHRSGVHMLADPTGVLHIGFTQQFGDLWAGAVRTV
jgi:hypothetical protein